MTMINMKYDRDNLNRHALALNRFRIGRRPRIRKDVNGKSSEPV